MTDNARNLTRSAIQLACFLALAVLLPAGLCRVFDVPANVIVNEAEPSKEFDPVNERDTLLRSHSNWVLIGNSMLNTRLDHRELTTISGVKARKVSRGGSQSGLWFLFLKKIVIESGSRPSLVTIFFRETDLTWPDLRIEGLNKAVTEQLQAQDQPEWQQVLTRSGGASSGVLAMLDDQFTALYPTKNLRPNSRRQIQNRSFRLTRVGTEVNGSVRRIELNNRFDLTRLRQDLGDDLASSSSGPKADADSGPVADPGFYEDGPTIFDPSPEKSFLPHLIALAKQNKITLHFHRIKRRPFADNTRPDGPAIESYMDALSQYLQAQGCLLTDESKDQSLTLDMYADGDHISSEPTIQKRYLQNFWDRVRPIVERIKSAPRTPSN